MTSALERELEATVDRYCEMVTVMEQSPVGTTDFQALYSKVKAEQELYIQQKGNCQRLPTYQATERIRLRFKTAHARMRALERRLKEQGVVLLVPPAEEIVLFLPEERRLRVCQRPEPVGRLPIRYELVFVVVGTLLFVTGLLVGLNLSGYL